MSSVARKVCRLIDKAVDALVSRMGTYDFDHEVLGEDAEVDVVLRVDDEPFRMVEVVDVYVIAGNERDYSNIERLIRGRLMKAARKMNESMEAEYIEGLSKRQRRDYYAEIA